MTQLPYDAVADTLAEVKIETVRDTSTDMKGGLLHTLADTVTEVLAETL